MGRRDEAKDPVGSPIVGHSLVPSVRFLDLRQCGAWIMGLSRGQGGQSQNSCTRGIAHRTPPPPRHLTAARGLGKLRPRLAQGHTGELRRARLFILGPASFHYTNVLMLLPVLPDNQSNSFLCNSFMF